MAAFNTCDKVGLMPHARHDGRGVWALAAVGSKLTGTGFEKLHIVQTQVAAVRVRGSDSGLLTLSLGTGEMESFLDEAAPEITRLRSEERFDGFGVIVILGEDLRKPAYESYRSTSLRSRASEFARGSFLST